MYTSYGFIGKDKIEYVSDEEAVAAIWVLLISIKSLVYGLRNFNVQMSLFGSAENTAKLGLLGVFNLIRGGSAGVLLFVPSVFYFVFKLVWAGLLGYIALTAKLSAAILTRTVPLLKQKETENE